MPDETATGPGEGGQPDEWYADGLRFECTQCGNCCTGPPGAVWFTDEEGDAMALQVGLEPDAFRKQYARRLGRRWTLKEHHTKHGYDCIFLDRETVPGKAICGMYAARPGQCRTWPFWPENVRTQASWDRVKSETPCPGMNTGALVPIEEIRIRRDTELA